MRFLIVAALACVSVSAQAADSPADKALKQAIDMLKVTLRTIKGNADREKVQLAIARLEAMRTKTVDVVDLIDNTEKYKGKTVTVKVRWYRPLRAVAKNLQEQAGYETRFDGVGPKDEKLVLIADIPSDLKVVKARSGDLVLVTFKCTEGTLDKGNTVTAIKRP